MAGVVNRYADWRLPGARTSAIARTRLIDDALGEALRTRQSDQRGDRDESRQEEESAAQVVILGAGFDCRAYRLVGLAGVKIFEVDHPATLATKRRVLNEALPRLPENVKFVEIDFNRQALPDVLRAAGFRESERTTFLWEGVTNYLKAEAVDSVLRFVARCGAGSRIVFTYVHAGLMDGSVGFEGGERILRDVARIGEPWTFGIFPGELGEFLGRRGLRLELDLSADEYRRRYFGAAAGVMKGYGFYHVAVARVAEG
jgi:methyltransferase (TIGR00027 family)